MIKKQTSSMFLKLRKKHNFLKIDRMHCHQRQVCQSNRLKEVGEFAVARFVSRVTYNHQVKIERVIKNFIFNVKNLFIIN